VKAVNGARQLNVLFLSGTCVDVGNSPAHRTLNQNEGEVQEKFWFYLIGF
jgi:hypothetical protein